MHSKYRKLTTPRFTCSHPFGVVAIEAFQYCSGGFNHASGIPEFNIQKSTNCGCTCGGFSCNCNHGTPGTGCSADGEEYCYSCNTGYTLTLNTCQTNSCTCTNGVAESGAACTVNGAQNCASCSTGFSLVNNLCVSNSNLNNICTCDNGNGATGVNCPTDGVEFCETCSPGYTG